MKLTEYLDAVKISRSDFAAQVGVSQSYITQLCQGDIWPGREVAARIMAVTNRKVGPADFIDRPPEPSRRAIRRPLKSVARKGKLP